ncbi:WYL domain-containing protein [Streptomyces sp. NPDC001093]|uniref:WYL domain-containing protein n=1 Tax=Streptomyces sp. NPDC001093 TaxID=3154376 RepID=UPI0033306095
MVSSPSSFSATDVRALPGSFDPPSGRDAPNHLLTGFATAKYRHQVAVWIRGTPERIRAWLPESVAVIGPPPNDGGGPMAEGWFRVELRAERLDWVPPALAALDLPFRIEGPQELRDLMLAFTERLGPV